MTEKQRQELCDRFSQIYAVANPNPNVPFEKFIYDALLKAFIAGAEYAWNNPNWISVEDELPVMKYNGWRSDDVFFVTDDGQRHYGFYREDGDVWFSSVIGFRTSEVTNWMPLPQQPRKED